MTIKKTQEPFFLIVKKNTFNKYKINKKIDSSLMIREEAIEIIIKNFKKNYKIISTT